VVLYTKTGYKGGVNMRVWLKKLREEKGYTQEFVAQKLGINQNTYSRLENGIYKKELTISLGSKISDLFNIPLSSIRNYEEELASINKGA
jgi:DNA-binding XRE family transcriptional regulator